MSSIGIADYDSMIDCQSIVFLSLSRHYHLFPSFLRLERTTSRRSTYTYPAFSFMNQSPLLWRSHPRHYAARTLDHTCTHWILKKLYQ